MHGVYVDLWYSHAVEKYLVEFPFPPFSLSETSSVSNSSDGGLYTNDEGRQGMYWDMYWGMCLKLSGMLHRSAHRSEDFVKG